ncbi:MAG: dockerin type I domain-containing protein, partial [Planctomycetota bacterium]
TYSANPADASPLHDVLLFNPPSPPVTIDQINYFVTPSSLGGSLTITAAAGGEAEYTNSSNPLVVNNDGFVTPIDALLIINNMNSYGSRALVSGGGGETGAGGAARVYLDVNADKFLSAIDALLVCNFLNKPANGEGEGSASSDATLSPITADADLGGVILVGIDTLPSSGSTPPAVSSATGTVTSVAESKTVATASLLPETSAPKPFVFRSAADTALQDVLDDLAQDLAQIWG